MPRRAVFALAVIVAALVLSHTLSSQPSALTVLSKDGRRSLATTIINEQEFVALDDLATMFQLVVREDALGVTVSYKGKTVVLTLDQALASVSGRLVSLPAPPVRGPAPGRRWLVPAEFINRALALVYDTKLDLRKPSRLVIVGDLRAPRVQLRYEAAGTGARLTIDATPRTGNVVAQDNEHITIRFDADVLDIPDPGLVLPAQSAAQGVIQAVRQADPTTIVLDVGPRFGGFKASNLPIDNVARLVIDVTAATQPDAAAPPPPIAAGPPPDLTALIQAPASIRTIAIDPGHGGDDEGAKGGGGTKEKDLTLAVARRIKGAIEARLGIRVLLTRDDDRRVPIDERTAIANNSKSDLFISLHANASLRPTLVGTAIYSAAFAGNTADTVRAALASERVPAIGGNSREIEFVPWDFAQAAHVGDSDRFAKLLEAQFQNRVTLAKRPVESAPLRVLESANMPAVLIEMGYLTNPDQEKQLAGAEFQNTFVQAVLDAIIKFRELLDERRGATQGAGAR